ncbi:MAG: cob(I)yrinic acid a,c-diamide adenosyltransferase [Candidatus Eisenbacteria bacterium]|nr:cob(I)yrinic acid a,c-diamide adenosyltransferase [Candidatus Eisenbacteria bacterium]
MDGRIYSRRGDDGETQHPNRQRVPKDHPDLALLGTLDELTSQLGAARAALSVTAHPRLSALADRLEAPQRQLLAIGALLGGAPDTASGGASLPEVTAELERLIDDLQQGLPPIEQFVIPGATPASAALHVARAVCRRAERTWVTAQRARGRPASPNEAHAGAYLNRLSDLLFVAARLANEVLAG